MEDVSYLPMFKLYLRSDRSSLGLLSLYNPIKKEIFDAFHVDGDVLIMRKGG